MATTASLSSNMSGTWSKDYFIAQLQELVSLQHMTVASDVPGKLSLPNLSATGNLVAETCTFTPTGTIVGSDVELILKGLQTHKEWCMKDLRSLWDLLDASKSFQDGDPAPIFQQALIDLLVKQVKAQIETQIWMGDGTSNEILGFVPAWVADNDVTKVTGATTLTKGNIVAEVEKALTESNQTVLNNGESPVIGMNKGLARIFSYSQQDLGYLEKFNADNPIPFTFAGEFNIAICNGMPDNTFGIWRPENLFFGTGSTSDYDNIRLVDHRSTTNENKVTANLTFGMGVQYRLGTEITLYNGSNLS